jgi:hypothetical protein
MIIIIIDAQGFLTPGAGAMLNSSVWKTVSI